MKFGFIIDNRKCIGCHACTVACKSEHDVPIGVNRTWVKYVEKGEYPNTRRLFSVMRCNHCEDAPCVTICPVTALHTREDGIVDFDNRRCIGCKSCMQACPYDALYIDPSNHTAAKCNYCAHRIDIGLEPACVNVCPEHAIVSGDMDDSQSEIAQLLAREQVTSRKVEKGTVPKLFYIEGDESSLRPSATEQSESYLWSSQSRGVGHYAQYAESRKAAADPMQMLEQLAGGTSKKITGPNKSKPADARRVYDAPSKGVLWGWEVVAYTWTKAIAAGSFLMIFLASLFESTVLPNSLQWLAVIFSLVFLALTGAFLIKDLDKPSRFAYVLLRPQWNSWLVRGGYAITVYGALLTLWGVAKYLEWGWMETLMLWVGTLFAIITATYTAFLFAQAKGRDFWQSPTLSLHMLVHAIMAGAAVFAVLIFLTGNGAQWNPFVQSTLFISIALNLIVVFAEIISSHPTADAKKTVQMIVSGRYKNLFWQGSLVLGNLIPLILIWTGWGFLMALGGILLLAGLYITEHIWVNAPQQIQLS
ncbi:MAG: polysulfide reductase NrfD [SAR324 cluster bacterium]|nr:polysulfide reductase NrfD [SAR324 cluster bacterium]